MERLQALGEQLDIAGLVERLQQLPLPAQIGVGVVVLFLSLIVLRLLSNILVFGKPPVFEGIPYIGGLIKFSKVSFVPSIVIVLDGCQMGYCQTY